MSNPPNNPISIIQIYQVCLNHQSILLIYTPFLAHIFYDFKLLIPKLKHTLCFNLAANQIQCFMLLLLTFRICFEKLIQSKYLDVVLSNPFKQILFLVPSWFMRTIQMIIATIIFQYNHSTVFHIPNISFNLQTIFLLIPDKM